ncbi:hypothetical protein GYMLUDRAFT_1028732 [Collybiopsis luxurians FD-317 M1]|uniref:Uncharacterized protein n=1 Tax=Collybiopsis luxurians FD-317 M1 TaxID=944289 RepID=A0A0D0BDC0_9AGAR|nr:hypothetical protein GYMLUDRAFT_1028732 [Collybiopsis luxurians FD-317 M1]
MIAAYCYMQSLFQFLDFILLPANRHLSFLIQSTAADSATLLVSGFSTPDISDILCCMKFDSNIHDGDDEEIFEEDALPKPELEPSNINIFAVSQDATGEYDAGDTDSDYPGSAQSLGFFGNQSSITNSSPRSFLRHEDWGNRNVPGFIVSDYKLPLGFARLSDGFDETYHRSHSNDDLLRSASPAPSTVVSGCTRPYLHFTSPLAGVN